VGEIPSQNLVQRLPLVIPVFGDPEIVPVFWVKKYYSTQLFPITPPFEHIVAQMLSVNSLTAPEKH
jgi:hypothetical protein